MSRKKTQPKKVVTPDPIFNSTIIPKLINCGIIVDLNIGSGVTIFLGCVFFLDIFIYFF